MLMNVMSELDFYLFLSVADSMSEPQLFLCLIAVSIYALLATVMFIIVLVRNKKRVEKNYINYQGKILSAQMEEMRNLHMTMRGWRHDYHNHMQKIRAHLALGQADEVNRYIDQMENELAAIDFKYKTGNSAVDAILNSKLTLAENNGLKIKCDVSLPEELPIEPIDLCVLLGNLIDNAIEACEKLDDNEKRFLRIYMCIMKQHFYVSVSNATNEVVRRLDKEYITNKRGNHGYGLRRIDLIAEKYDGYVNRQNEPGVFATEIMLPIGQSNRYI